MIAMKGPLDWLKAIHVAAQGGVQLKATWFGDGSMLPLMRQEIERLGIGNNIVLAGIVDRQAIMANLKKADIFLFCHKTGESPRCLGEALAAGCPLVGYGTAYSRALVATRGGGEFAEINDWQSLGQRIVSLDQDRDKLEHLIQAAAACGALLDRDAAMQIRIDLIKKYLPPHPNSVP
jgi:glycosyltransferase involved in cell wall biosynthesis